MKFLPSVPTVLLAAVSWGAFTATALSQSFPARSFHQSNFPTFSHNHSSRNSKPNTDPPPTSTSPAQDPPPASTGSGSSSTTPSDPSTPPSDPSSTPSDQKIGRAHV